MRWTPIVLLAAAAFSFFARPIITGQSINLLTLHVAADALVAGVGLYQLAYAARTGARTMAILAIASGVALFAVPFVAAALGLIKLLIGPAVYLLHFVPGAIVMGAGVLQLARTSTRRAQVSG